MNDFTITLIGEGGKFSNTICDELYFGDGYDVCLQEVIIPPSCWDNVRSGSNWIQAQIIKRKTLDIIYIPPKHYAHLTDLLYEINCALIDTFGNFCDLFFYYEHVTDQPNPSIYPIYKHHYIFPAPTNGDAPKHFDLESQYPRKFVKYTKQRHDARQTGFDYGNVITYNEANPPKPPTSYQYELYFHGRGKNLGMSGKGIPNHDIATAPKLQPVGYQYESYFFGGAISGKGVGLGLVFSPQIAMLLGFIKTLDSPNPMIVSGCENRNVITNLDMLNIEKLWVFGDFVHPTMMGGVRANLLKVVPLDATTRDIAHHVFIMQDHVPVQRRRIQKFTIWIQDEPFSNTHLQLKGEIIVVLQFTKK
jgi:hypothetical protein